MNADEYETILLRHDLGARGQRSRPVIMSLALPAAAGVSLDLAVGARAVSARFDGAPWSVHAAARVYASRRIAVELGGAVRLPSGRVDPRVSEWVWDAWYGNPDTTFEVPVERELGAASLLAELSPFPRDAGRLWVYAALGAELRVARVDVAGLNERYPNAGAENLLVVQPGEAAPQLVPALGLGFDMWLHDHVGMRILGLARPAVEPEPYYGRHDIRGVPTPAETRLRVSAAVSVDVLVRL